MTSMRPRSGGEPAAAQAQQLAAAQPSADLDQEVGEDHSLQ